MAGVYEGRVQNHLRYPADTAPGVATSRASRPARFRRAAAVAVRGGSGHSPGAGPGERARQQPAVVGCFGRARRVGSIGSHLLTVTANGLRFHVEHAGEGPAVLLLHGFPDTGDVWRHQVPALAAAGLRTLVPDLRGRGRSERPQETSAYALPELVADATGILDAFGIERAHIVGHDWGAAVAWAVAALAPERVDRLVVMSVGFPGAIRPDRRALEQGWYRLLVLFPQAEALLLRDDAYLLRTLIAGAPDADRYLALLADPEALTAGLAWYRANSPIETLPGADTPRLPPVGARTLGLFGANDPYLTERAILASETFVTGGWHYHRLDRAGHWPQLEQPDQTNELLLDFLA
jgi:pimeloyl-ACP methyl ester carboxylesterase